MDLSLYGLDRPPFDNTPNPAQFVNLLPHRQAMETLQQGIDNRKGLLLVTGAPGTGKTLMGRMLKARYGTSAAVALVARPCATTDEFWSAIMDGFRLSAKQSANAAHELERFAEQLYQQDLPAILLIDAAHELPDECLELVRHLASIEADDMPLIQIVLLGWPKLAARFLGLAGAAMQQRVYRHVKLEALSESDTALYIRSRVCQAGGPEEGVFTEDAARVVHRRTGGIPRLVNWLCEALLTHASDAGADLVDADRAEAIAFDMSYDPELFQAQLTADEAGVLFNAQLKDHPVIRELLDRLAQVETAAAQCATDTAQIREREPATTRQLRRYDRIFERMVPLLRSLERYRKESETVLAACKQTYEQMEEMLKAPESVLQETRRLSEEIREAADGARGLIAEARATQEEIAKNLAASEQIGRRLVEERDETLPVMDRTKRLIGVLRKVHHVTHERCQRLDDLSAKAQDICETLPGRISDMEAALAAPEQLLGQMREMESTLRRHVEVGEEQARGVQQALEQAVRNARNMREEIERARDEDETSRRTLAPGSREAPPADLTTSPPAGGTQDLAQRVRELSSLVRSLRHSPAAAPASSV